MSKVDVPHLRSDLRKADAPFRALRAIQRARCVQSGHDFNWSVADNAWLDCSRCGISKRDQEAYKYYGVVPNG